MPDVMIVLISMASGLFLGVQIAGLAVETRHDCMPHDPKWCKERKDESHEPGS